MQLAVAAAFNSYMLELERENRTLLAHQPASRQGAARRRRLGRGGGDAAASPGDSCRQGLEPVAAGGASWPADAAPWSSTSFPTG